MKEALLQEVRRTAEIHASSKSNRDAAIVRARAAQVPVSAIAAAAGVSKPRIFQILEEQR